MSADTNASEVQWLITYESLSDGQAIGAGASGTSGTTLYQNAPGAAETREETAEFTLSGVQHDDVVGFKVERKGNTDANNDIARLLHIEIEYVMDKLGGDEVT